MHTFSFHLLSTFIADTYFHLKVLNAGLFVVAYCHRVVLELLLGVHLGLIFTFTFVGNCVHKQQLTILHSTPLNHWKQVLVLG